MNLTSYNHFGHFFIQMWPLVFTRIKKGFLSLQTLISCNLHSRNFGNFFHIFSNQIPTRSYNYMCPKMICFKILVLVLEMEILECFCWKHSQKPLGVKTTIGKYKYIYLYFLKYMWFSYVYFYAHLCTYSFLLLRLQKWNQIWLVLGVNLMTLDYF